MLNRITFMVAVLALGVFMVTSGQALTRYMETLNRGVVAVNVPGSGIYVGWRMFGTDPETIGFNIYRDGVKITSSPITTSTNYMDTGGLTSSTYYVKPVIGGVEQGASETVTVWTQTYGSDGLRFKDVPIQKPANVVRPDGSIRTYSANDCSVGDLDGDGQYEIVLKWDPNDSKDNAQSGVTGNVYIDAYKLNGTFMWRIDLGRNIRAGAHYTQFMVYDLDGDGKAEVACKTAPGTVDGAGNNVIMAGDNPAADYRNSSGYILSGPEYLTIFNGQTGAAMATTAYDPPRGTVSSWGDSYGNRVDRFLACIAYVDGVRPSLVMCRGYYTRAVLVAWNWRNGALTKVWKFDSDDGTPGNSAYRGQGNHNLAVGDVDGDGYDEIVYGSCCIDHNGTGKYVTGLGHGDAMHFGKLNPGRAGLQVFQCHEGGTGESFRDAGTGQILWQNIVAGDNGRAGTADLDPATPGEECWSTEPNLKNANGTVNSTNRPSIYNFAIWWDADLSRELFDADKIDKWDPVAKTQNRLVTVYHYDVAKNNGTKQNPCLQADIFGDWREEFIERTNDSSALRIFTPVTVTSYRIFTLMHDPIYRMGIAWQNVAYNQPPHTGFFLGNGMTFPVPLPDIMLVPLDTDTMPPTPSPMTWQLYPYALGSSSITMTATTATDASGVEYYFSCVSGGGHASGWQTSPVYTDTGLTAATTYQYAVQARDTSSSHNLTGWSATKAATTYATGATTRYEAENQYFYHTLFATNHIGYSGTGFADTTNEIGSYVEWTVTTTTAGAYGTDIRFSNGTTTNRPMSIMVNGVIQIASLSFVGTTNWDTWATSSTSLNLLAGTNAIRLTSLTTNGGPNLDRLDITAPVADLTPPTPSPAEWLTRPVATSYNTVTMRAMNAGDASGVEYYFWNDIFSDRSHDSGWQDSPEYTDSGLTNNSVYTYNVGTRDKSTARNESDWSDAASVTTPVYTCQTPPASDMSQDCKVDFADFAMFAGEFLLASSPSPADFDSNNRVDFNDLVVMTNEWLACGRIPATECP